MLTLRLALPALPMTAALSASHLVAVLHPPVLRRLYIARDADRAIEAWHADETLDNAYANVFREALQVIENPKHVAVCTQILFIAKNVERIGDHVTNVAETIYFLVHGERLRTARPRGREAEAFDLPLSGTAEGATE